MQSITDVTLAVAYIIQDCKHSHCLQPEEHVPEEHPYDQMKVFNHSSGGNMGLATWSEMCTCFNGDNYVWINP